MFPLNLSHKSHTAISYNLLFAFTIVTLASYLLVNELNMLHFTIFYDLSVTYTLL